jgi:putative copper export protein
MTAAEITQIWLAIARYLIYVSTVLMIGAFGARLVVMGTRFLAADPAGAVVTARVARSGFLAALGLMVGAIVLIAGMAFAWFGLSGLTELDKTQTMVFGTAWGVSWQRLVTSAAIAAAAGALAWRWRMVRGPVALGVAVMASMTVPLLGHGGTQGTWVWIVDSSHLFGSGLWLGTLAVLARATWPVWRVDAPSPATLRGLLASFSPIAFTGAAMTVVTGGLLSYKHLDPFDTAFSTEFGQTLIAKVVVVAALVLLGWLNYRRHRGPLTSHADRRWLRRLAVLEAVLALVVVLGITAWLTGLPVPHELLD